MATGKAWSDKIKKMSTEDIQRYKDSIRTLFSWEFFKKEWGGMGLSQISYLLEYELMEREKQ